MILPKLFAKCYEDYLNDRKYVYAGHRFVRFETCRVKCEERNNVAHVKVMDKSYSIKIEMEYMDREYIAKFFKPYNTVIKQLNEMDKKFNRTVELIKRDKLFEQVEKDKLSIATKEYMAERDKIVAKYS